MKKLSKVNKKKYGAGGPAAIPYRVNTGITKDMANNYAYNAIRGVQNAEAAKQEEYDQMLSSMGNQLSSMSGIKYITGGEPCQEGFYRDFNTGNCIPLVPNKENTLPTNTGQGVDPNVYGIAGTAAEYMLKKGTDDNNLATVTDAERFGNMSGSILGSAGKGAAMGAMFGPMGIAAGALLGAGVGYVKGRQKNKLAKKQASDIREEERSIGVANREAMLSNSMPNQTGFGYNSSTNMNMQPTNYFANAKLGGVRALEGGVAKPIAGSDAVKFEGRSHAQGGIKLDSTTEVEGGETMDKVVMKRNGGTSQDYFFSKFLKLGGKSFSKRHEEILKSNLSAVEKQNAMQDLAKMQESKAGRDPNQVAKLGGVYKYELAGFYKKKPKVKNVETADDYQGTYTSDYVTENDIPKISIQEYYTDTDKTTGNPKDKQPYFALYDARGYEIGRAKNKEEALQKRDQFYNLYENDQIGMDENGNKDVANPYKLARGRYNYIQGFGVDVKKDGDEYIVTDNSTGKSITTDNPNRVDRFSNRRLRRFNSKNDLNLDTEGISERDALGEYGELISEKDGYQIRSTPYTQTITDSHSPDGSITWNVKSNPHQFPYRVYNKIGSDLEKYIGDYADNYDETNEGLDAFLNRNNVDQNKNAQPEYKIPGFDALNPEERKVFRISSDDGYETFYKEKDGKYKKYDVANNSWVDVNPDDYTEATYSLYTPKEKVAAATADEWLAANNKKGPELYENMQQEVDATDFKNRSNDPTRLPSTDLKDDNENWISGAWKDLVGTTFGDLIGLDANMTEDQAKNAYDVTWKDKVDEAISDPAKFELLKNFFNYYISDKGASARAVKNAFGDKDINNLSEEEVRKVINKQMKDGKFGPFHRSLITFMLGTADEPGEVITDPELPDYVEPGREGKKPCPDGYYPDINTGECVQLPNMNFEEEKQSLLPALAQLIPVGYRLATPYNKERGIPGNISPERVVMGRVNLNRDRQLASQAYTAGLAATRAVAGPGSIAGIQALSNKLNTQLGDISDRENKINTELNTREAAANAQISSTAADLELKRQSFNSANRKEEERYRIERIESGLDAAAERITGIVKDEKLDRFNRDLTRVLDNTHSYDRYTIYKQILAHSKMEDSPFYGKSDAQLRKIAAAYAKQIYGDLQIVADSRSNTNTDNTNTDNKKLGGERKYTSRLGQLVNSGRRTFNI